MDPRLNDPAWLAAEYQKRALASIARTLGVHRNTVRNRLIAFGIPTRSRGDWHRGRKKSPKTRARMAKARELYWSNRQNRDAHRLKVAWAKVRQGPMRKIDDGGYIHVIDPREEWPTYIREHRLVMELTLGRRLLPAETVHHRDGNRTNNDISNLELWCSRHPKGQRVGDMLAWAREIITLYGNLPVGVC